MLGGLVQAVCDPGVSRVHTLLWKADISQKRLLWFLLEKATLSSNHELFSSL